MDKIKTVKIKNPDGSVSQETYTISADAKDVDMKNGKDLQETIGNIDIDNDGNIAEQLEDLDNNINILNLNIKKKVYFFDTVADMKADTKLKAGDMAITKGYYSANDGGAGTYNIVDDDTLIDDGGSIHELDNGLFAKLIINENMNVNQFGAKGDGTTDDTKFIQIAIDNCNHINFNNKTYLLTDTLTLKSNINLIGNNTTLQTSTANLNCFTASNLTNIIIKGFTINGFKRSSNINNCSNINISDLIISTTEWGLWLSLCNKFIIENITFNQLRTTSYSNKDGVHINGGKNGVIRNIYGTTDDDMIALNADESFRTYGEISNIIIDNVVTKNNQEYGLPDATYQGIKLISYGSLIDNITIQNCNISSDYVECVVLTGDENANIGDVYINNCVFNKKHTRINHIIEIAVPYKKLHISNCKLINSQSTSGSFIHESNNYIRNNLIIDNVEFIDNSSSERGIISLGAGSKDSLTINNINCIMDHLFQLITIKENIKNVNINNIFTKNQRYIIAVQSGGTVAKINLSDISSVDGTSVINIKGQVSNLNMNNIITDNTTYVCNIETEQLGLIATASNIISSNIDTIDTNNSNNIRLKSGIISEFIPGTARGGDTFIYRNSGVYKPKIYSNNQWNDV